MTGHSVASADAVINHLLEPARDVGFQSVFDLDRSGCEGLHDRLRLGLRNVTRAELAKIPGVQLHAAACCLPSGRGLLFPGRSGAGKSTLTALLASEMNAGVVADDSVVLQSGRARGLGLPITIRQTSPYWAQAQQLWYADNSDRLIVRADDLGGNVLHDVLVDTVVLPVFGSEFEVQEISSAASFSQLSSMLMRPADEDTIMELAHFAGGTRAFFVNYRSADEALTAIEEIERSGPLLSAIVPERLRPAELAGFDAEVWGVRFDDEVALFNRSNNQVAHLSAWRAGAPAAQTGWSAITRSEHVLS